MSATDFEISLDNLKTVLQSMRDLGRPETMGIHFLDWKWYDNWEDVQHEALEMSEARAHFLHREEDEVVLLRVKTLLFWCIRGSIRGWHELTETRPGSGVVQIACLRTEWSPHGHWRQRRLGEYHQESLLPAVQDLRSLAASLQSVPELEREHGWLLEAAHLCETTCLRYLHGPFGDEASV